MVWKGLSEPHPVFAGAVAWALATVFVVAAGFKAASFKRFVMTVSDVGVPARRARHVAVLVIAFESIVAVTLAVPQLSTVGAMSAVAMMSLFTVTLGLSLYRGERFPCMCFGDATADISTGTLVRNGALLVTASILVIWHVTDQYPRAVGLADHLGYAVIGVASVASVTLLASLPQLLRLNAYWLRGYKRYVGGMS
jgi:hypothetical protein